MRSLWLLFKKSLESRLIQKWLVAFEEPKFKREVLSQRILMNAEAFGFGPSAAIAEFFPYLRDRVSNLAYIGSGHTLNLQSKLPYNQVFDMVFTRIKYSSGAF